MVADVGQSGSPAAGHRRNRRSWNEDSEDRSVTVEAWGEGQTGSGTPRWSPHFLSASGEGVAVSTEEDLGSACALNMHGVWTQSGMYGEYHLYPVNGSETADRVSLCRLFPRPRHEAMEDGCARSRHRLDVRRGEMRSRSGS